MFKKSFFCLWLGLALLAGNSLHAQEYTPENAAFKLLHIASNEVRARVAEYNRDNNPDIVPLYHEIEAYDQTFRFYYLSIDDYARMFRITGGPTIERFVGLNFNFICNTADERYPRVFALYTAFLCLVIGFHWFTMINNVATGKTPAAIIPIVVPLLGKFAVGMLVAYNLPTVYAYAMTMKNVGQSMVMWAMQNNRNIAQKITDSDPSKYNGFNDRQKGILMGIDENLFEIVTIQDDPNRKIAEQAAVEDDEIYDAGKQSNRKRLAMAVAYLNYYISQFYNTTALIVKDTSPGAPTPYVFEAHSSQTENHWLVNYVGFERGAFTSDYLEYVYDAPPPAPGGAAAGGPEDFIGRLTLAEMIPSSDSEAVLQATGERIYTQFCQDMASSQWLAEQFVDSLKAFMLNASSVTLDGTPPSNEVIAQNMGNINDLYFAEIEESQIAVSRAAGLLTLGLTPGTVMGDTRDWLGSRLSDLEPGDSYVSRVQKETAQYFDELFLEPNPIEGLRPDWWVGTGAGGVIKEGWNSVLEKLADWVQIIAQFFLWLVKSFWVPMIAFIANFLFNVTIEAYVYILWLAFPFWFHQKTEQAFKGALNTMFSVCFTAATFTLLAMIFESFASNLMENVIGSKVTGFIAGAAIVSTVTGGVAGPAAVLGIAVGYSIFYMIGTALCLVLAPKLFSAFLKGSSVVTPMIMGAVTAVAGGALGATLAAGGIGGALAAGKAAMGSSALGTAAKAKVAAWSKGSGVTARAVSAGRSVASGIKTVANLPSTLARKAMAGSLKAARRGSIVGGAFGSALQMGRAAKHGAINAIKNPGEALKRFASSKTAQMGVVVAAGASGDLNKLLNSSGAAILGPQVLSGLSAKNTASVASASQADTNPQSGGGGGASPAGGSPQTAKQKRRQRIEEEVEIVSSYDKLSDANKPSFLASNGMTSPDQMETLRRKVRQDITTELEITENGSGKASEKSWEKLALNNMLNKTNPPPPSSTT